MPDPSAPIVTTGVTPVYASRFWQVEEHTVIGADGAPGMYNVLYCGDGVCVLAVAGGDVFLIREYKYALRRRILQLPAGGIDDGEDPVQAAKRELREETGLVADTWTAVGTVHPYPTSVAATVHLFIASDARPVQEPEPGIELLRAPQRTARNVVSRNDITHAASLACLLTYLLDDRGNVTGAGR